MTDEINLVYTHCDRLIFGSTAPKNQTLVLDHMTESRTPSFLDRREMADDNIDFTDMDMVGMDELR